MLECLHIGVSKICFTPSKGPRYFIVLSFKCGERHRASIGVDGQRNTALSQAVDAVVVYGRKYTCQDVTGRADLQMYLSRYQIVQERWVLDRTNPVTNSKRF